MKVTPDMKLTLTISNMKLVFNSVMDTKVGSFTLWYLNAQIAPAIYIVSLVLNAYLA